MTRSARSYANHRGQLASQQQQPLDGFLGRRGVGRVFRIGQQPLNVRVEAYKNVAVPQCGPGWNAKFIFQFLFPQSN